MSEFETAREIVRGYEDIVRSHYIIPKDSEKHYLLDGFIDTAERDALKSRVIELENERENLVATSARLQKEACLDNLLDGDRVQDAQPPTLEEVLEEMAKQSK